MAACTPFRCHFGPANARTLNRRPPTKPEIAKNHVLPGRTARW